MPVAAVGIGLVPESQIKEMLDVIAEVFDHSVGCEYVVRAANTMGGLGPASDAVSGLTTTVPQASSPAGAFVRSCFNPRRRSISVILSKVNRFSVLIHSLDGRIAFSKSIVSLAETGTFEIPVSGLKNGIYLMRMEADGSVNNKCIQIWK